VELYPIQCGILWKPSHYILPELHIKIGLLNNALDNFYDWVEAHGESASLEEKLCRIKMILLDTKFPKLLQKWRIGK
jgi:hypothetical protein